MASLLFGVVQGRLVIPGGKSTLSNRVVKNLGRADRVVFFNDVDLSFIEIYNLRFLEFFFNMLTNANWRPCDGSVPLRGHSKASSSRDISGPFTAHVRAHHGLFSQLGVDNCLCDTMKTMA